MRVKAAFVVRRPSIDREGRLTVDEVSLTTSFLWAPTPPR